MHKDLPSTPLPVVPPDESGWFRTVELEINTACDLACFGCDRMSDVTTAPNMNVDQVRLFVRESLELDWEWERIRLLGGEPTLHPHLKEIVEALRPYRQRFPGVFIQLLSNGLGKLDQLKGWLEAQGVDCHVEGKTRTSQPAWFRNTRITPVDRDPDVGPLPPCGIFGPRDCGIGLTRHGYFLDGAGATVARVAGLDVGVMSLHGVTLNAMLEQAKVLCRVCGHWNPPDGSVVTKPVSETGQVTGPFWTRTLALYKNKNVNQLRLYGQAIEEERGE